MNCNGSGNVKDDISSVSGYSLTQSNQVDHVNGVHGCAISAKVNEGAVFSTFTGIQSVLGSHLDPKQGCRQAERVEVEGKKTDARQETERWRANEREEEIIKERERKREQERGRRQKREAENQWRLTFDRLHPNKRPAAVLHAAVPAPCLHLHPPLLLPPPLPSSSSASSSSFSFHRTVIQHHLALPPPPPPPPQPHLPLTPYPHLLPSFPHHPPPPPPSPPPPPPPLSHAALPSARPAHLLPLLSGPPPPGAPWCVSPSNDLSPHDRTPLTSVHADTCRCNALAEKGTKKTLDLHHNHGSTLSVALVSRSQISRSQFSWSQFSRSQVSRSQFSWPLPQKHLHMTLFKAL
ncbi:hypothetical protein N1851_018227 [Merluccius polli]|uniref:Uncharacterized protein n=1 Tax=Merluccius polli TaxID=89951 RepID=A0AA47P1L0_MERPO|nr:hypothetical protein N1851_018227 [Merluccius polli]